MANSSAPFVCLILVLCFFVPSLSTDYTVGDTTGWALNADYTTWTSAKTFSVGDTLVFNYGSGHTVDEVSASDYNSCTVGNSITSDSSGATTITLKTSGTHYYICGVLGHCGSGMKLAVTVAAGGTATSPSGSSPPSGISPPAGTTTTTPSPPKTPSSTTVSESSSTALSPFVALLVTLLVAFFKFVIV